MKRYELTGVSKVNAWGVTVYRIRALVDIPRFGVKKGDLGGWVESELLRDGAARVSGDAWVSGAAQVSGAARVSGDAQVSGAARVSGDARVFGDARVSGDARVFGDAQVSGAAHVTEAWHCLQVGPIGSENVIVTLYRTKNGKHRLHVGCWGGTLGTLMTEVKRRRESWVADDVQQELWVAQYKALKSLGKATVARWEATK